MSSSANSIRTGTVRVKEAMFYPGFSEQEEQEYSQMFRPRGSVKKGPTRSSRDAYRAALSSARVKVNFLRVFLRLLRITFYLAIFRIGVLRRRLSKMELDERHKIDAVKFREMIVTLGSVLIKVGQQLSQRPDLLPVAYCEELESLLDKIDELIPQKEVEAVILRETGQSIDQIFESFQWDPVLGSASVACVYKARLHSGELVAVKVRRPNIDKKFAADLRALEWILHTVEFLTIWRPGMTRNFRGELKDLLLEELDFRREARNQEIFRRYHERRKKLNVTAPKVFYEYSGQEVLVGELVTGIKMDEILRAFESGDESYLAFLDELGIEPKRLAKQLVRSRYYSFHECPLFHGDPHPANIIVQPDNKIVMIDFGACGVFSQRDRNLMWQLNQYYAREDVQGMVNMVLAIMEPLDPVYGINDFKKELTDEWWTGFYGIKSKHAQWWERSSFRLWRKFLELARRHQVPLPQNMVRMIRATLLYDTVAAKLYPDINVFKEFERYSRGVARRTRRQIEECFIRQMFFGPDDRNFLKMQQVANVCDGILFRVQKYLDDPGHSFLAIAGKAYSAIRSVVRAVLLAIGGAAIAGVAALLMYLTGIWKFDSLNPFSQRFILLMPHEWHLTPPYSVGVVQLLSLVWLLIVLGLVIVYGRRIYLRFGDVDD
jgi:ubiquinone biosynthesis protein